jgi:N-acetylglucosamine kinase-like BadF-type ATPase
MTTSSPLVLGIDGGGTKTVAWLAQPDLPSTELILGRGIAGPGNPRAAGFDVALANIDAAIDAAFADAKLPRQSVAAACFGLAGCGRVDEQQQIAGWADSRHIAQFAKVTGDAEPILAAASPDNCGVALICGTGSLAWGRNERGDMARAGGWGYLIGDEGSGYAIALAGLRAAVRAADGRGPQTTLLSRFQQRLDAATPADVVGRIYAMEMTRDRIASLAETVFDSAASDEVARDVVEQAALDVAKMISAVAQRLEMLGSGYTLALAGGVLLNQPDYRQLIRMEATALSAAPANEILVSEPVAGAVTLALQLLAGR